MLKNIGLFVVAPVVGLAYFILFPFVGIGALSYISGKALYKKFAH